MKDGATRGEKLVGGCDCEFRVVHGTERDHVEEAAGREGLGAMRPDLGTHAQGSDDLAEECGLFILGFRESDGQVWMSKGDGQAGKSGTGAEIKQGGGRRKMARGEEGLAKVTLNDLLRSANGRKVGSGVPFEQEIEVAGELAEEFWGWVGEVGGKQRTDAVWRKSGHSGAIRPRW